MFLEPNNLFELSVWNLCGLTLVVVGLTLAITAAVTLMRFYSSTMVTREDHQLIKHGMHRYVRRPLYLGVLMACMGAPVYGPSPFGFLIMGLLVPIFLIRIHFEEQMLSAEFGVAYHAYQQSTRKPIPFVY